MQLCVICPETGDYFTPVLIIYSLFQSFSFSRFGLLTVNQTKRAI